MRQKLGENTAKVTTVEIYGNEHFIIPATLNAIQTSLQELQECQQATRRPEGLSLEDAKTTINAVEERLRLLTGRLKILDERFKPEDVVIGEGRLTSIKIPNKRTTLNFDDAVNVVISLEDNTASAGPSRMDIESLVNKSLLSNGSMNTNNQSMFKRRTPYDAKRRRMGNFSKGPALTFPPRRSGPFRKIFRECRDCGARDHIRGDVKCKSPSHYTRVLRDKKLSQQNGSGSFNYQSSAGNFRKGSCRN